MAEKLQHDVAHLETQPQGLAEDFVLHKTVEINEEVELPLESTNPAIIQEQLFGVTQEPGDLEPTNQVVDYLHPRLERAEDGTERVIFTKQDVSYSFKSPEEYPLYPAQQQSKTTLLTEASKRPIHTGDPYGDYKRDVMSRMPETSDSKHFTVDHTLTGILKLTTELGAQDESLRQLTSEVQQGRYPERALLLLDALAAASYVNENGEITYEPDSNGDALVVESLLGNVEAQKQVAIRVARLHEHDKAKLQADHIVRQKHYDAEGYGVAKGEREPQPSDFMAIHATGHRPQRNSAGQLMLQTRFDTVGFSRPSLHFSMNHLVESHTLGQFDNAANVVVAPFDKMLAANGKPKNIVGVDTWWTRNPGEAVVCPEATLVEPNTEETDDLFVQSDDSLKYKTADFTEENIAQMVTGFAKVEGSALLPLMSKEMRDAVVAKAGSIHGVGLLLLQDAELRNEVITTFTESQIQDAIAQKLRYLSKKLAVNTVLQQHNAEVFLGGEWSSSGEAKVRALVKYLDVDNSAHSETPEYRMEQQNHEKYDPSDAVTEDIARLDPKSRRVLLASGIKAARRPVADAAFAFDHIG